MERLTVPPALQLTDHERGLLSGDGSAAAVLAMGVIVKMAEIAGAERLVEVSGAHIDSCLYHGPVGLDFAERLVSDGARVTVPATLNVSALDLLHPSLVRLDEETQSRARRLMDAYVAMGCQPTWTCAPYQLPSRPAFGEHVAWAESNAIVFANSVLGARTGRYGDFLDICAAITGRVPLAGLHLDDGRRATVVFRLSDEVAGRISAEHPGDEFYGLVGHIVGRESAALVPAVVGLPADTSEDDMKALGAAAASAGSVALCHVVGVTPEAATLADACAGRDPERTFEITARVLGRAWDELSTINRQVELAAVSIGTPHFSAAQFRRLVELLDGRTISRDVPMYVSSGRDVLATVEEEGTLEQVRRAGLTVVADTCTYITPIVHADPGSAVMTNSAKWAWYAPGNMGVQVVYGSLADCVESAIMGRVIHGRPAYLDG